VPPIRTNKAKEKLAAGQVVTTISGLSSSEIIDFMGPLGFDAAWIEGEHGSVTWEQLGDMTRACDLLGGLDGPQHLNGACCLPFISILLGTPT